MAMIHVNRSGTNLGTFSEEDVRAGLRAGRLLATDLGWREGMAQWQPLSQFTELAADIPAGAAASSPPPAGTPPTPGLPPVVPAGTVPPLQSLEPRSGLPWEHRETRGFFQAFADTLSMVLTKPAVAFTVMRTEGDFGGPLLYAIIGGAIGAVVAFFLGLMVNSFGLMKPRHDAMGAMFGMTASGFGFVGQLIAIAILPFIWGGLVHLALMLLGGAKKTFEATFRVIAFSQGSTAVLQLIPCCGGLVALVWNIVVSSIGIARAHETDTGRATFAVLLPLIVCCGGGLLILMAFFGGIAALSSHDWNH
jgi:hypothetical protein